MTCSVALSQAEPFFFFSSISNTPVYLLFFLHNEHTINLTLGLTIASLSNVVLNMLRR